MTRSTQSSHPLHARPPRGRVFLVIALMGMVLVSCTRYQLDEIAEAQTQAGDLALVLLSAAAAPGVGVDVWATSPRPSCEGLPLGDERASAFGVLFPEELRPDSLAAVHEALVANGATVDRNRTDGVIKTATRYGLEEGRLYVEVIVDGSLKVTVTSDCFLVRAPTG